MTHELLSDDHFVDVNSITPEQWRAMTVSERREWSEHFRVKGIAFFACASCGYPLHYGQSSCEACE